MSRPVRILGCLVLTIIVAGLGYERMINAGGGFNIAKKDEAGASDGLSAQAGAPEDMAPVKAQNEAPEEELLEVPLPPNYEALFLSSESVTGDDSSFVDVFATPYADYTETTAPMDHAAAYEEETVVPEMEADAPANAGPNANQQQTNEQQATQQQLTKAPSLTSSYDSGETGKPAKLRHASLQGQLSFSYEPISLIDIERRSTPKYPSKCLNSASNEEFVIVRFQINNRGWASVPKVAQTTNDCFNNSAIKAARRTRFNITPGADDQFVLSYLFKKPGAAELYM